MMRVQSNMPSRPRSWSRHCARVAASQFPTPERFSNIAARRYARRVRADQPTVDLLRDATLENYTFLTSEMRMRRTNVSAGFEAKAWKGFLTREEYLCWIEFSVLRVDHRSLRIFSPISISHVQVYLLFLLFIS